LDEYETAGALLDEPVDLVKCETVHIEVHTN
jgi:UbiD family decarboxylase